MSNTFDPILEQQPTPAWLIDRAGRLLGVNRLFTAAFGTEAAACTGLPLTDAFAELIHPAELEQFEEALALFLKHRQTLHVTHRLKDAGGGGFCRCVTRARPLDPMPMPMPGLNARTTLPQALPETLPPTLAQSLTGGILGVCIQVEPQAVAGSRADVPVPNQDATESPALSTAVDHACRAQYHALPLRVADLETLLDVIPIAIGIFDALPPQRLVMNPACAGLLGVPQTRSIDLSHPEALPFTMRAQAHDPRELRIVSDVFRLEGPVDNRELAITRRDGSAGKLLQFMSPLLDESGIPRGAVAAFVDITDRKAHEEEMRHARESAEQANRAKDRFIAMLSHELRTPLTPVLVALSDLRAEGNLPPGVLAALSMIERNVELEARLIDDLLDLTKISRGKLKLHREVCDIHPLVVGVMDMLAEDVRAAGLRVNLGLRAKQTYTRCDPARIQQVLWNLIKNALKFTPAGGSIDVRTANVDDEWLRIEVRDTGVGIDAETLPRIFFAFEQADTPGPKSGGLGLGLTISKVLIDMHGGRLKAHSDGPGTGSTFIIELDLSPQPTEDTDATRPAPGRLLDGDSPLGNGQRRFTRLRQPPADPPAAGTDSGKADDAENSAKHQILFIDDHPDTCRAMRRLLARLGFEVTVASSVAEAVAAFHGMPDVDLVISDIGLPDGTGVDLIQKIHQVRKVPAIALSGYGMEEDVRRSRQAGFAEHLIKPISITKLDAAINRLLDPAARPDRGQ